MKSKDALHELQAITARSFYHYGKLIHYPNKHVKGSKRNLWRIIHAETAKTGWRIAYLVLRDKSIARLEAHPYSAETFEPLSGRALFFVSQTQNLKDIVCFVLDRPVLLFKGIWHGLIALDKEAEIKITENDRITCRYWPLGFRIQNLHDLDKRRLGLSRLDEMRGATQE
jgi:ureidoglycolate hydrolase